MGWESVKWLCKWHIEGWGRGGDRLLASVKTDTSLSSCAVIVVGPPGKVGEGGGATKKQMTPAVGKARLASRRTPRGALPRCGISVAAGPGRSKVGEMTTRSALRAPRGLGGRHVFLIEPRWSEESLILISGDRNPIFRGDSWESGSPRVRDDCLPVKPLCFKRPGPALYTQRTFTSIWHEPRRHSAPTVSLQLLTAEEKTKGFVPTDKPIIKRKTSDAAVFTSGSV